MIDNLDKVVVFHPNKTYQIMRGELEKPKFFSSFSKNPGKTTKAVCFRQKLFDKSGSLSQKKYQSLLMKGLFIIGIFLMGTHLAHAEDLLASAFEDASQTFIGSGKKFIYLAEIIISIVGFMKTRNILILTGCVIIALFLNFSLKMVGI